MSNVNKNINRYGSKNQNLKVSLLFLIFKIKICRSFPQLLETVQHGRVIRLIALHGSHRQPWISSNTYLARFFMKPYEVDVDVAVVRNMVHDSKLTTMNNFVMLWIEFAIKLLRASSERGPENDVNLQIKNFSQEMWTKLHSWPFQVSQNKT